MRATHIITGRLDEEGIALQPVVDCLNDANDPKRDCRHGAEAPDCEYAGSERPEGGTYPCGGFYHSEAMGQHIHPYDAESRNEDPCALRAWWDYTGMMMSEVNWRNGDERPVLPVAGHVEWTDYDPMFVPLVDEEHGQRSLRELQREQVLWVNHNFPDRTETHPLLGLVEEVGELSHAHLKHQQGIRGMDDEAAYKAKVDAVGDIVIYLADYCSANGIDLHRAVFDTWGEVAKRDWQEDPEGVTLDDAVAMDIEGA